MGIISILFLRDFGLRSNFSAVTDWAFGEGKRCLAVLSSGFCICRGVNLLDDTALVTI